MNYNLKFTIPTFNVLQFFKRPMEEQKLASNQILSKLFGNVETILNVNKELLVQLHPAKENVGEVFLSTAPFLKLYSVYAFNYKNVIETLQVSTCCCLLVVKLK